MVLKNWVIIKQYLVQLISYLLSQQYDNYIFGLEVSV